MKNREKILDDLARAAGGFVNMTQKARDNVKQNARLQAAEIADKLDLIPREDFYQLEQQVIKIREENEQLKQRIEKLEKTLK